MLLGSYAIRVSNVENLKQAILILVEENGSGVSFVSMASWQHMYSGAEYEFPFLVWHTQVNV